MKKTFLGAVEFPPGGNGVQIHRANYSGKNGYPRLPSVPDRRVFP